MKPIKSVAMNTNSISNHHKLPFALSSLLSATTMQQPHSRCLNCDKKT